MANNDSTTPPTLQNLQDQEMDTLNNNVDNGGSRIWCDGCYDLTHFGHANNLRQARRLGESLIVGVHSDEEIEKNKGSGPVLTSEERYIMVEGIKWVDQVVPRAPYVTTLETLDKYGCQGCAHGSDITTTKDGFDTYQLVKDAGRYLEVERAQGVSTTDLVKRILNSAPLEVNSATSATVTSTTISSPYTGSTQFLSTVGKLCRFYDARDPPPNARVVYVDGTFDLFHPGHLAFLKEAKKLGDYLWVGIHDDQTCARISGQPPIMSLLERVQNILGFRYVDDVVIGAPFSISEELLKHLNVAVVAHGMATPIRMDPESNEDPYKIPKKEGIFQEIDSGSRLTTSDIIQRVWNNREKFEKRNAEKEAKELATFAAMQVED